MARSKLIVPSPPEFRLVVATRLDKDRFFSESALGRSFMVFRPKGVQLRLFTLNGSGLPSIYNTAIQECIDRPQHLVFAHDDIYLHDYFWIDKLTEAFKSFGIVGVAGCKTVTPNRPAWCFADETFTLDKPSGNLSGTVGHGKGYPPIQVSYYGPSRTKVALLDGLFLACRADSLFTQQLRFDETFKFHFYDMDFCRQASAKKISLGTWDISLTHESMGGFNRPPWRAEYTKYRSKWGET
jgi:hypothetical protein